MILFALSRHFWLSFVLLFTGGVVGNVSVTLLVVAVPAWRSPVLRELRTI